MHSVLGSLTNEATTGYNPSCGLDDITGDDPDSLQDPELPVQQGNPIGGPGPGEPGNEIPGSGGVDADAPCKELDDRQWRHYQCDNELVTSHIDHTDEERWIGLDVPGAWVSTLEFMGCRASLGLQTSDFSDVVCFEFFV